MKISFSAMKGNMGKRDFYVAMIKLSLIPKIFSIMTGRNFHQNRERNVFFKKAVSQRLPSISLIMKKATFFHLLLLHLMVKKYLCLLVEALRLVFSNYHLTVTL